MMREIFITRLSLAWLILIGITFASWVAGHSSTPSAINGALVLGLAFAKVAIVVWDFMEVRHAPVWLQIVTSVWVISAASLLIALYVLASQIGG